MVSKKTEKKNKKIHPRDHLLGALKADLIGPFDPHMTELEGEDELLSLPPSRWYLTGFLAPSGGQEVEEPLDDEIAAGPDFTEEETQGHEPMPKVKTRLPASMGLSVLIPAPKDKDDKLTATVSFAEYRAEEMLVESDEDEKDATGADGAESQKIKLRWRRHQREPVTVTVPLEPEALNAGVPVAGYPGIMLKGKIEELPKEEAVRQGLSSDATARSLAVFLVNERPFDPMAKGKAKELRDEKFLFQVCLKLRYEAGFYGRQNRRGELSDEWDERVADLQFRNRLEYGVGHGVSVHVPKIKEQLKRNDGKVTVVESAWLPRAVVPLVTTHAEPGVVVEMEKLATLSSPQAVEKALSGLVKKYGEWIDEQRKITLKAPGRQKTRDELMQRAARAKARIAEGIEVLKKNEVAREAFRLTNQAMATAALKRNPERYKDGGRPEWRLFQLAFVLLNLASTTDETHRDRENVELIFFPTGGGKTEAYLGVIAYVLLMRRLLGQKRPDKGLGVAVLLRYTLRLLTLDQLGRAATLICALEVLRQERPEKLGDVRFAVGLWVGRSATANTMKAIAKQIQEYKSNTSPNATSPFPLTNCPWCGAELKPSSLSISPDLKDPKKVTVGCSNFRCDFNFNRGAKEGLPVLFVDEQVYSELPGFIVATVDKFAMMPWRGETGMLFGRAKARMGNNFFGPMEKKVVRGSEPLPDGLRPPELIVQDELHLISGPLGTMVGLYETAIEALSTRTTPDGEVVKPKIIASTATVRRARHQVTHLFGRKETSLFPPPGVDDSETYFAKIDHDAPGRLYVGVAASGRTMKGVLLRAYITLLSSAKKAYNNRGEPTQPADGYMTLTGYFNSLRELGGMRRLVEDDILTRCLQIDNRRPVNVTGNLWFQNRRLAPEPVELTSRETTERIKESKARLALNYKEKKKVDVLLASNMISVGIDIDRLGLMVVAGQPKTTSEYIQASSRVGRQKQWPGLVVTCLNLYKPRDRSHYERFTNYHESFYRFVEAQSLTPFSGPAIDRGLAGTLVSMVRLMNPALTPPDGVNNLHDNRKAAEKAVSLLAQRAASLAKDSATETRTKDAMIARGKSILDSWESIIIASREGADTRSYSPFDRKKGGGKPLLFMALEDEKAVTSDEKKFCAPTSMRDVEPTVHLWLKKGHLGR